MCVKKSRSDGSVGSTSTLTIGLEKKIYRVYEIGRAHV